MPTVFIAVRATRWLSSVMNSFAIEASWFGIWPAFCMWTTRYDSMRATLVSM